jgi:hypothetical protein
MFIRDETYEQTFAGAYIGDFPGGYTSPVSSALGTTWLDGTGIVLGTATGSMVGTDPAQKLGLWGATPVVRPAALTGAGGAVAGTAGGAYTATEQTLINSLVTLANNLRTRVNELETKLQAIGALS